jgi:WD40 repeat protein
MNNALVKYSSNSEIIAVLDTDLSDTAEPNPIFIFNTISRLYEKIPTKDHYQNFIWSPDSQTILGILNDNTLALIDIKTLNTTKLPTDIKADIEHISWFPDSQKIIIVATAPASADKLLIYDINSNTTTEAISDNSRLFNNISYPIVTADGQLVYYIGDGHLYSLNIYSN